MIATRATPGTSTDAYLLADELESHGLAAEADRVTELARALRGYERRADSIVPIAAWLRRASGQAPVLEVVE